MITSVNGMIKAYWYQEGYLRTTSEGYSMDDINDHFVHLTNDAVQKKSPYYGKFEPGNKLSYVQFQRYLDNTFPSRRYNFKEQILNKMKKITLDVIKASFTHMDKFRKKNNF